jgi:hypothetical protein
MTDWGSRAEEAWRLSELACFRLRAEILLDHIDKKKLAVSYQVHEELHRIASVPKEDDGAFLGPFDNILDDED